MGVVNDWGGVAKVAVIEHDGGGAEMAVNGAAAATVVQGQESSGTAKAAAGTTPMDD
jgi:hypothetical protein